MSEKNTNKLVKYIAVAVLLPLGVAIPLLGLAGGADQPIYAEQSDQSLQQRITNYKKGLNKDIKAVDEKRVEGRCSVVKANIDKLADKAKIVRKDRDQTYKEIKTELEVLYDRLEVQAFETTKLKINLDTLYSKMSNFNSNAKNYEQALNDMQAINCAKEPNDFLVTLEAARRFQTELIISVGDIRTEATNTIRPSLLNVKKQIQDGQTVGGDKL